MCDCQSSNRPDRGGTVRERVLDPRPYFDFCTKTVCVDDCIADDILTLWRAGIFTRLSCCNHNLQDFAEVALYRIEDVPAATAILRRTGRDWRIFAHTEQST